MVLDNGNSDLKTDILQVPNETLEEKGASFLLEYANGVDYLEDISDKIVYFKNKKSANLEKFSALEKLVHENPNRTSLFELFSDNTLLIISHSDTENIILHSISSSNLPNELEKADRIAKLWLLEFIEYIRELLEAQGINLPRKYPVLVSRPRKYFFPE
jgi:hypothetical protein